MNLSLTTLQQAALEQFALTGFDATSLAQIAGETGIKKPSIYAHFASKEALFMSLVEPAIQAELEYTKAMFAGDGGHSGTLRAYLESFRDRYRDEAPMRFVLRLMFLPPAALYAEVMEHVSRYVAEMESFFTDVFRSMPSTSFEPDVMASAYFGMVGSLQSEILYGTREDFNRRLRALWDVFSLALNPGNRPVS